jgi:N-acetylglutamate synthase-like GNAT family acetyltransferase
MREDRLAEPGEPHRLEPETLVRTFTERDRLSVKRLSTEGLLPDQVDYESQDPDTIERTYLASPRDHFWVAEVDGEVVGTVALRELNRDVGHLHWLRVSPAWQANRHVARRLVQTAAAHARKMGFLKLVLHTPDGAQPRVSAYFHLLGFELFKRRTVGGRNMLEFYLNLYAKPPLASG